MSDKMIRQTHGANRAFDPARVAAVQEGETVFISAHVPKLMLLLKKDSTTIIDGKAVTTEAEIVQFEDSQFRTSDPVLIEKIKSKPAFKNGDITDLSVVLATKRQSKVDEIVAQLSGDETLAAEVVAGVKLKRGRSQGPTVEAAAK